MYQLMQQPVEQPCYCDFMLYGKKRKYSLYKYSNNENIPYQFYYNTSKTSKC